MTKYKKDVHSAYRGGRVECFKTGKFKGVNYIDCNNLYGYASMNIRFPDLRTERKIWKPLGMMTQKELLKKIGLSRVMIVNKNNDIGLIPIRTDTGNYFPKKNKYIIGTYTHIELEEAIKEGYEIIDIEWSLVWNEAENPFKEITPHLYELRKRSGNEFDKWFFKELQNRSYGKLAQMKSGFEIVMDNVEEAKKYIENNWKIIKGVGYNYMYEKDKGQQWKKYYAPIIPTLINAWSRIYMYKNLKRIPKDKLLYTDTDSCVMEGNYLSEFNIGEDIGQFKIEHQNKDMIIYGRKTYLIGEDVKIAGFTQRDMTKEKFEEGNIESKKMMTIKSTQQMENVGGFEIEKRDLKEQEEQHKKVIEIMEAQEVYIDKDITNINHFSEILEGLLPNQ